METASLCTSSMKKSTQNLGKLFLKMKKCSIDDRDGADGMENSDRRPYLEIWQIYSDLH